MDLGKGPGCFGTGQGESLGQHATMEDKLKLLTDGAKYDVSCASSGSRRGGGAMQGGVCHSWSADGRCISLLKLLLSNACVYDCAYCVNRRSNDTPRTAFTPAEVAELTVAFYRRNYIEGLFLSSGVLRSPDYTMELLIETGRLLREEHGFRGYLHLKVVPGADPLLVARAGRYADRVSVNIELPTAASLTRIAPEKSREAILQPMGQLSTGIAAARAERRRHRRAPDFAPAGQSTQLIVGASPEHDLQILRLAESLYHRFALQRVYYSAFVPVTGDPRLPALAAPPLRREHRLYQADWLLRFYGFAAAELLDESCPDFDPRLDPKAAWALRHREYFPVEVNRADYETLLRVPGIGVRSARRILRARRSGPLRPEDLSGLGLVLRRARYFITCNGRYAGDVDLAALSLRGRLLEPAAPAAEGSRQLSLFTEAAAPWQAAITGEF